MVAAVLQPGVTFSAGQQNGAPMIKRRRLGPLAAAAIGGHSAEHTLAAPLPRPIHLSCSPQGKGSSAAILPPGDKQGGNCQSRKEESPGFQGNVVFIELCWMEPLAHETTRQESSGRGRSRSGWVQGARRAGGLSLGEAGSSQTELPLGLLRLT